MFILEEYKFNNMIFLNFVISVWTLIGITLIETIYNFIHSSDISQSWGVFSVNILAGPFIILFLELIFWLKIYRSEAQDARIFAGLMAFFLSVQPLFISLLWMQNGYKMNWFEFMVYFYVVISHLLFAIKGYGS